MLVTDVVGTPLSGRWELAGDLATDRSSDGSDLHRFDVPLPRWRDRRRGQQHAAHRCEFDILVNRPDARSHPKIKGRRSRGKRIPKSGIVEAKWLSTADGGTALLKIHQVDGAMGVYELAEDGSKLFQPLDVKHGHKNRNRTAVIAPTWSWSSPESSNADSAGRRSTSRSTRPLKTRGRITTGLRTSGRSHRVPNPSRTPSGRCAPTSSPSTGGSKIRCIGIDELTASVDARRRDMIFFQMFVNARAWAKFQGSQT